MSLSTSSLSTGDCLALTGSGYTDRAIAAQRGKFEATWDVVPGRSAARISAVVALAQGAGAAAWTDLAAIARFNANGTIDARNGGAYAAMATVPFTAGMTYHVRMPVDVAAHTYSVYVTPAGGTEQLVAKDYAFRTEQREVTQLDHWMVMSDGLSLNGCLLALRCCK